MSDQSLDVAQSDIAIVGMALRVPGAQNPTEFWGNLSSGVESIRTLSADELIAAGERPDRLRRPNYVPRTADLASMEMFDADFFGLGPKDAAIMDPQHRQFLECAWEAFEDAGRPPESVEGPVGVFAGCGMGSYFYFNVCSHRDLVDQVGMFLLRHTGNDKDFLVTRASHLFDLRGPSVNIQTACSTSLVAIHYACMSLINGECDAALAGGSTIELPHRRGYLYQEGEILSPDGHCRAFDHRAQGTVFGSGVGVVMLRRLADALADGDPIRAVIKATAVNNDGATKAGYLAPSVSGQADAVVEALGLAGLTADDIQYVECHGTGTNLGDPIEIAALTQAYRNSSRRTGFCRVGSVKTNIGHLDTAAGVTGLIKTVLAIENAEIPATLGFEKPNPAIAFETTPFVVADRRQPWPATSGPRRAAVNSLGVGGTNAHAIVEQAPPRATMPPQSDHVQGPHILMLSGKSRKALDAAGTRLAAHLSSHPDVSLKDVAHTLFSGRRHFEHRRILAVGERSDAIAALSAAGTGRAATQSRLAQISGAVFLCPGGGAQYPGMARSHYRRNAGFRASVDEGLSYLPSEVAAQIRQAWLESDPLDGGAAARLFQPSLQLPAILIVEIAIARMWMHYGVRPTALIGHSMGENAAACIAGVLSFEHAVQLVRLRGELFGEIKGGGMLSVGLSLAALQCRIPPDLDIASVNGAELCVVSGRNDALETFRQVLVAADVEATRIAIDIAAHSSALEPILGRFEAFLRSIPLKRPGIPIISNRSGGWLSDSEATDPAYWVGHLRSTVLFADGLATLAGDPDRVYIEVGPGRALSSLVKAQGQVGAERVINSLPHPDERVDDNLHFLTMVARGWAAGLPVDTGRLWPAEGARRISLPTYPFQHQRYFLERVESAPALDEPRLEKIPDLAAWGWLPTFMLSQPPMRLGAELRISKWLVFLDDTGVGKALATKLISIGQDVVSVAMGDAYAKLDDRSYVICAEQGREGYDALLQDLARQGNIPARIVHLSLLTLDQWHRPGSSFFDRVQERGFNSLLFLAQALGDAGVTAGTPIQVTVVTNGLLQVEDEALTDPAKATVLGPAQVIPRELPGVSVRVIDVPLASHHGETTKLIGQLIGSQTSSHLGSARASTVVDRIWDDLFAENGNEIVAYRGMRRWVRTYEPCLLPETTGSSPFRDNGVYLVTGGLGDLGLLFALELARHHKARLVLVGRTALPDRSEWDRYLSSFGSQDRIGRAITAIRAIEESGGKVLVAIADITNPEAMAKVVAQARAEFGPINGLLHTAGVVRDGLIALKTLSEAQEVLAPKVLGTAVLDEVLKTEPLEIVALFSSTSSGTAPAGQVDYVAANAYLNAYAASRSGKDGPRVVAVNWGIWKNVGLAARAVAADKATLHQDVRATSTPLFDRKRGDVADELRLDARWDSTKFWVLNEHRLKGGLAVWPGTGYLEAAAQALVEAGLDGPFEIEDLTFQRPLGVPEGEARNVRVTLRPDGGAYRFSVESEVRLPDGTGLLTHADAKVRRMRTGRPAAVDIAALERRMGIGVIERTGAAIPSTQSQHLRFGPRWSVLRSVRFGEGEALAGLELSEAFLRDLSGYRLHPALLDIATGFAMDLISGYSVDAGLWVPMSYGRVLVHRVLPARVLSHVWLDPAQQLGSGYATFDVTLFDDAGNVLAQIERFTIKQMAAGFDVGRSIGDTTGAVRDRDTKGTAENSPALARLADQLQEGIEPSEGFTALKRAVAAGVPQIIVSSMNFLELQKAASILDVAPATQSAFERPELGQQFVAPRNEIESKLAGFWSELLGIEKIGVDDSFFDLGGHSLIAVRLFRMIKNAYATDLPISVLLEAPTIARCAALIEAATGANKPEASRQAPDGAEGAGQSVKPPVARRFVHVVPMHPGRNALRTPLFVCAGMFGNVLNLRHLAEQVGQDRAVYGLQAKGLFGGDVPHETFEEMARDYLAEVRQVQPSGPYLLSGFSGGGLVAYEMAHQLEAAGEVVDLVVLLDTPYPEDVVLSRSDRISMKLQDLKRGGAHSIVNWAQDRIAWERHRRHARHAHLDRGAAEFHNEAIEAAFRRALGRYKAPRSTCPILLMRPRLDVRYRLSGGRELNFERSPLHSDNGWSPFVENLTIIEVPGDHDSMVLEPNVRVLTAHLRRALIARTERAIATYSRAAE